MQTIPTKYHKEQVTLLQNSPQLTPGLQIQLKVTKEVKHKFHLFQSRKNLQIKIGFNVLKKRAKEKPFNNPASTLTDAVMYGSLSMLAAATAN